MVTVWQVYGIGMAEAWYRQFRYMEFARDGWISGNDGQA